MHVRPVQNKQHTRNRLTLLFDVAIFIAFLVIMAPHWSGTPIHEWLSIAFAAAIVTHLLLNWQWIIGITKRFFQRVNWFARTNYILNVLLFIVMTVAIFTGLMISESVMSMFGIQTNRGGAFRQIHELSANASLVIIGIHLAFNWQWIAAALRRYVIGPLRGQRSAASKAPQPALPEA